MSDRLPSSLIEPLPAQPNLEMQQKRARSLRRSASTQPRITRTTRGSASCTPAGRGSGVERGVVFAVRAGAVAAWLPPPPHAPSPSAIPRAAKASGRMPAGMRR